jgi:hypothetical protein
MNQIIKNNWLILEIISKELKVFIMKSYILIIFILVSSGLNAQKKNLNLSSWHMNNKIESSDYMPAGRSGLYCFISNDNENVYFEMKVKDRKIQNRILTEGLTIWINMDGKEEKKMGIRFPLGSRNQPGRKKNAREENIPAEAESTENLLAMANTIEILGFLSEEQRRFPAENRDSFRGSVTLDEGGILYYKLIMPVAKLPLRNSREAHSAMPFILGIEYGSLPAANKSGVNRGPAPSSIFHSRSSGMGGSELIWIKDVRLATSK